MTTGVVPRSGEQPSRIREVGGCRAEEEMRHGKASESVVQLGNQTGLTGNRAQPERPGRRQNWHNHSKVAVQSQVRTVSGTINDKRAPKPVHRALAHRSSRRRSSQSRDRRLRAQNNAASSVIDIAEPAMFFVRPATVKRRCRGPAGSASLPARYPPFVRRHSEAIVAWPRARAVVVARWQAEVQQSPSLRRKRLNRKLAVEV